MIKAILQDKEFLKRTFIITIPIVVQNLLNNLLNLMDTLMIGQLGETPVAAVGLANRVFFVFSLLMFGICSGSSVLASQYWGRREILNIRRVLRVVLIMGFGCSLLFMIPGILSPKLLMRIFTPKAETIAIGAEYLFIIAFTFPLTAITNAYTAVLRSMNYVKLPMVITGVSVIINFVLNAGLIFGLMGMPKMGAAGAAVGTLVARIFECGALITILHLRRKKDDGISDLIHMKINRKVRFGKRKVIDLPEVEQGEVQIPGIQADGLPFLHRNFILKYIHTAAPVIGNEFMWGLGVTMYSLVYGRMGDEATAAITITSTVEQVALVFFFGMCAAAAVVLGNELGENRLEDAERHAKYYMVLQFVLSVAGALIVFFLKDYVHLLFREVSPEVTGYIRMCLVVFCIYMPARMLNTLFIVSILRAGGDTKAALFLDVTSVWLIGIPMAVFGGLILKLPIYTVYAMILCEEVYKLILGYRRYRKKLWVRNIVS